MRVSLDQLGENFSPSSLRAKRSNPELQSKAGLLRRFAPRNDDERFVLISRINVHEIPQQRIDLVVPALAGEHAVMADAGLHVVDAPIGAYAGAEILRGERL